jgi:signal transduction histidine kinase
MRWPAAKRSLGVYLALGVCSAGLCAWQWQEHRRFKRDAAQALIDRGRDITSTLGVVVRSQRRWGIVIAKERVESALQDLVRPSEAEAIAILGATGETIASAGPAIELTPEMLRARGVYWREHSLVLMNLMDLGLPAGEDRPQPPAIVVTDERMTRAFRPLPANRRQPDARANPEGASNASSPNPAPPPTAPASFPRTPYGRPAWMSKEEYDAVIQKQGVHSLVISLSTDDMHHKVRADLLLRSLVSLLGCGGALISALAWRNFTRNAELQIRLVKAGEANAHLSEMNFAAAGLAHETRNPLNLIRGHAHLIREEPEAAPKLQEHAAAIIEEADRVTVQLNEFINYSKPREAHLAPVDVQRLAADVARTLLPDIEDKQIQVIPPATPLTVEADEPLFRQALFNLLLNAIQAVGVSGRIEIRWSPAGAQQATLEVADDGPGVPASERSTIFKPYVTMREKGVGLGLAIVQQIVSAHRWEIVCDANQPRGAVFRIRHMKIASAKV